MWLCLDANQQRRNQLVFIKFLRMIVEGEISAEEAVKAYHGVLQELKLKPQRSWRRPVLTIRP